MIISNINGGTSGATVVEVFFKSVLLGLCGRSLVGGDLFNRIWEQVVGIFLNRLWYL